MPDTFDFLLEQAKDKEDKAALAVSQAQTELDNYYAQLAQISQYRQDYWGMFVDRGQDGLSASQYSHLNKFLSQLDETLVRQKEAEGFFKVQVENCREYWFQVRKQRVSYERIIEKRQIEERARQNKLEQKMFDEIATLTFNRRHF